jgi:hypothetical protein
MVDDADPVEHLSKLALGHSTHVTRTTWRPARQISVETDPSGFIDVQFHRCLRATQVPDRPSLKRAHARATRLPASQETLATSRLPLRAGGVH